MIVNVSNGFGRWEYPTEVLSSPFIVEVRGLNPNIQWHYSIRNGETAVTNAMNGNVISFNAEAGVLHLFLTGYVRGKQVMSITCEPLVIYAPNPDITAEPLYTALTARINSLEGEVARLAERLLQAESRLAGLTDRLDKVEEGYDPLRI